MKSNIFFFFGFCAVLTLLLMFYNPLAEAATGLPSHFRPENLPTLKGVESGDTDVVKQARFLIGDIITVFLSIAGIIAVWAIVNSAFWLVVSVGKGETIDQRKKALFWAIAALVLIILSYAIIRFITEFVVQVAEQPAVEGQVPPGSTEAVGP